MPVLKYVRRKDFKIELILPKVDGETEADHAILQDGLIDAIYVVKPSFLYPRLVMEVRQPTSGRIANAVVRLCRRGIPSLRLDTLFPEEPTLVDDEGTHHLIYQYTEGRVIEQETIMCKDVLDGDKFMTHTLVALFDKFAVDTHEWSDRAFRPTLLIDNTRVGVLSICDTSG